MVHYRIIMINSYIIEIINQENNREERKEKGEAGGYENDSLVYILYHKILLLESVEERE